MKPERWPLTWWARLSPLVQDGVLVAALLAYGVLTLEARPVGLLHEQPWTLLLLLLTAVPLLVRRRWPSPVMGFVVAVMITGSQFDVPVSPASELALLAAMYSAGALAGQIGRSLGAASSGGVVLAGLVIWASNPRAASLGILAVGLAMATALLVGDHMRGRRAYLAGVEARAERLEREREQARELATEQERARIARELHDVVAHHVSVIAIQAGSARAVRARDPVGAADALDAIEAAARQSLTELSRLLGVLRRGDMAPREPEPGLDQLERLLEEARRAGHRVELVVSGKRRPLPSGVDLSAYRIVQEAMTNVLKHARGASVEVRIDFCADQLAIEVADRGGVAVAPAADGRGHGLIGMRERVAVFGGHLDAGPTPGGGFRVSARLPVEA